MHLRFASLPLGSRVVRERRRGGYSLVELTMVLVTMVLLVAIAAPRYGSSLNRYRADSAARRVVADIGLAQQQARAASRSQVISFDTYASTYSLPGMTGLSNGSGSYLVSLSSAPTNASILSANFNNLSQLTFDIYGTPSSPGVVVLRVGSETRTIVVDAIGKATYQ